jgi:DNA-binding response OmpR family regulator
MRILVVEDEHKIANSIKRGFEQESWATDVAYDGEEGFDMASSEDYDVIVLDLMLPKVDGMEICRKLRAEENHTPILLSGQTVCLRGTFGKSQSTFEASQGGNRSSFESGKPGT